MWPLVERVFTECRSSDVIMQEACHCIGTVISVARTHATPVVAPYLQILLTCFSNTPTIFHLGSVRTITGLYGQGPGGEGLRPLLCDVLASLGSQILQRMQVHP